MSILNLGLIVVYINREGGGATWIKLCPDVCVQKLRAWVPFRLQGSGMIKNVSFKMGI